MRLSAIAALSENQVIGDDNTLPWHIPADLQHFKNLTKGKPIVMGRKTHESIGGALPNRRNIILSRAKDFEAPGCEVFQSIDEALLALKDSDEVFIIGGEQIYQELLPFIDTLYLTIVHETFDGDAFFPEIDPSEWKEISREKHLADDKNPYDYSFVTLVRN